MKAEAEYQNLMLLIRAALWGTVPGKVGREEYEEMRRHALLALPGDILGKALEPGELYSEWKREVVRQVMRSVHYRHEQEMLPLKVPYVILKGTAAARYYPNPELRTMGDIDIMTAREDYETACDELLRNGFREETEVHQEEFGRHRSFSRNGMVVEVHAFFALLNDPSQARYLDDLIIEHISPSHELPDLVNGLVLLEHIDQHLEEGLGLRQIIDWMMFADRCLTDEAWPAFREMAGKTGLETLARVTTRMCEIYLGLPPRKWCSGADETLCSRLMEYVMACGNFGAKRKDDSSVSTGLLTYARTPAAFFRLLQERGRVNWKAAEKYPVLRPFAWLYQLFRYQNRFLGRKNSARKIREEYSSARERIALFDALGAKQISRGLAVWDGTEYVKTYKRP